MAITGVLRPGHVAIRVLEMAPALKHYVDVLGLTEVARDKKGRVFLKAWDEHDHHSVVLREADEAGMDYMGWRVDSPATLKKLAGDIEKSKLCSDLEWIPAGEHPKTGERFRFTIPTGHVMELFAEKEKLGNNCGTDGANINPDPWPDGLKGIAPSRFDHCLLYGDDLDGTVKLFTEVLGFGLAEQILAGPDKSLMIGAFLSCSNKAHDVAFIRQPVKGKFHHASFELGSWEKVLRAADILSRTQHVDRHRANAPRHHARRDRVLFRSVGQSERGVRWWLYLLSRTSLPSPGTTRRWGRGFSTTTGQLNEAFLSVFT